MSLIDSSYTVSPDDAATAKKMSSKWYGSRLSYSISSQSKGNDSNRGKGFMQLWTVILLPIIGSIFLVILFFFMGRLWIVLIIYISLISILYTSFVLSIWLSRLLKERNAEFEVKWIGVVAIADIVGFLTAVGLVLAWNFVPPQSVFSTILTDLLAIFLAISSLCFVRMHNLMLCTVLLSLFFFYDIFWVFLSGLIFKKSVMVSVAMSMPSLPLVIIIPRVFVDGHTLLGLGDIILPGVFLCFLYHVDRFKGYENIRGYFLRALFGYALGLILAFLMVTATETGQPALLYLVPLTLGPTLVAAWRKGELRELWIGKTSSQVDEEAMGEYGRLPLDEMQERR
ncbi:signal peptide peptidase-like 2B-like [Planoprotostelium fungivorum]|uniref:Signal peptide peptidase-like 2B-like n=1 Tax=Planoprotostelium fungivorum TaxID=1890364 RepID=A0A2P6NNR9_9EUKA|nr:signal peptide peptidase-like 2B-like [Planoprotostelium fungivorum]